MKLYVLIDGEEHAYEGVTYHIKPNGVLCLASAGAGLFMEIAHGKWSAVRRDEEELRQMWKEAGPLSAMMVAI